MKVSEKGGDGIGRDVETARTSALLPSSGLAFPEYDIDEPVGFWTIYHAAADDVNAKLAAGYRLMSVSTHTAGSYTVSFVLNSGSYARSGNGWSPQLSETDLLILAADTSRRIVDVAAYQVNGQRAYTAVWLANGSPTIPTKVLLHLTPDQFKAALAPTTDRPNGWRVIDVEAQPVPQCSGTTCTPDPTNFEVTGVVIANDAPNARIQTIGYGPAAGNGGLTALPPSTSTLVNQSLGATVSAINGRTADFDTPFGDGNYFYVVEQTVDGAAAPPTDTTCLPTDVSTERNWWLTNLVGTTDSTDPNSVAHGIWRLGGRIGKIKAFNSKVTNDERFLAVYYDNEVPAASGVNNGGNQTLQKVDAVVRNRMKRWGEPAVTLGIVKDGQLVYAQGYGRPDLSNTSRVTSPTDLFRLASVSKPITQSLVLRLVQQGLINLNDSAFGKIFPYNKPGTPGSMCPAATVTGGCAIDAPFSPSGTPPDASGCTLGDIRVKDLLWHGSGLLNSDDPQPAGPAAQVFNNDSPGGSGAVTPTLWMQNECAALAAGQSPFYAPPGSRAKYMNTEFQILAAAVETVTGQPEQNYLASVLQPLSLTSPRLAHLVAENDPTQAIPYGLPLPYVYWGGAAPFPTPVADAWDCPASNPTCPNHYFIGSASIATTPADLLRWSTAIDGTRPGSADIISSTTFSSYMRVFLTDTPGKTFQHNGYFPGDTQAQLWMDASGISYVFATSSDALFGGADYCCPGSPVACTPAPHACLDGSGNPLLDGSGNPIAAALTMKWTHGADGGFGAFIGELNTDLQRIFANCTLPPGDHFHDVIPTEPQALCHDVTVPADTSCSANVTASQADAGSIGGTPVLVPAGPYGLGSHAVQLQVSNGTGVSKCNATITVVDSTPPVLTPPGNINVSTCDLGTVGLGTPTISDNCDPAPSVTARIISVNGTAVAPILITNGQVPGPGTYTIQWVATDHSANSSMLVNQTVAVHTTIETSQSFLVDDRAVVKQPSGTPASVYNAGPGNTNVGSNASTGAIVSKGPVKANSGATVTGSITSASSIDATGAHVSGTVTPFATLAAFPALPTLPSFPTPNAADATVNSGTVTIAPGSRVNGNVNGGTLVLQAGTYYFQVLRINSNTTVRAPAGTVIYVRDQLTFNSPIRQSSGSTVQSVFLGYAGTADAPLYAPFTGTFVAPNAKAVLGTGAGLTFTGSFFARTLEVTPASVLVCQTP